MKECCSIGLNRDIKKRYQRKLQKLKAIMYVNEAPEDARTQKQVELSELQDQYHLRRLKCGAGLCI